MKQLLLLSIAILFVSANNIDGQKNKRVEIAGKVVSEDNNPVRGARVYIDGTETSSQTDKSGVFRVKIKPTAEMLLVLKPDLGIAEQKIGDEREFFLVLNKGRILDLLESDPGEELVDIGYGTVKRKHLTTSIGTIDGEKSGYTHYNNIFDMIRGQVPGVQVNGTSITIRGESSINAKAQPLFVVDGVVVDRIADIPPSNIKSIQVLKGAESAIYGVRGTHGVILINLKTYK